MVRVPGTVSLPLSLLLSSSLIAGLVADAYALDNQLDEIVVTGSRVPTKPGAVAAKITTVDAEAIQQAGVDTNVMEILRKSLPSFQGRSNAGNSNANNTNQNTAGGASVQLRNLDTLILVNGRRLALSGIAAVGGKVFVDINQIPTAAIDHIEVLSDGASAIYGSDAVGGVVNIILKSDYKGGEAGFRYAEAKGGYAEQSSYFNIGDNFNGWKLTAAVSQSRSTPLYQNARSFSSPFFGTNASVPATINGTAILAPNLSSPNVPTGTSATAPSIAALIAGGTYNAVTAAGIAAGYDLSQFQTLLLKQSNKAFSGTLNKELIGKQLVVFGDMEFSRGKSFTQFLPIITAVTEPAGAPFNPTTASVAGVNFGDTQLPKQFFNDVNTQRATLGLKGDLSIPGWNWEVAYTHSRNKLEQQQANVLFKPNITLAIAGGYDASGNVVAGGAYSKVFGGFSTTNALVLQPALNPFARAAGINPTSLNNLYGTEFINTSSFLNSFDATLVGTILELPAGKPGFAFGLSHREEGYSAITDPNAKNTGPTAQQWTGGQFFDDYSQSRKIDASFLEVKVPVTSEQWNVPGAYSLDVITAVRQEHYSDSGNSLVPKVGFRWQPFDPSLTIRASYGKSFTAPSLYRLNGPTATRQIASGVITGVFPGITTTSFNGQDGNNPNLKPSKSNTYSLSATYVSSALPGLTLSAEYNAVNQTGYPQGIGFNNILLSVNQSGAASPFANNLAIGNFPGFPGATSFVNPGDLKTYLTASAGNAANLYAIDRFMNLGSFKVRAYSLSGQYELSTTRSGTFTLATTGTIFQSYKYQAVPYQNYYDFAGTTTNGGGAQGSLPKYRFYSSLDWDYQNWDVTLGNTYASATKDQGVGGLTFEANQIAGRQQAIAVKRYLSWDLRLAWKGDPSLGKYLQNLSLAAGANNITNVMPPLASQAFTDNNADVASFSPIGRLLYTTASLKF